MSAFAIGGLLGALIITLLLNRALHHSFRKTQGRVKRALFVAGTGAAVVVAIATFTMGFAVGVTTYLPAIGLWLMIDLLLVRRQRSTAPTSDHSDGG